MSCLIMFYFGIFMFFMMKSYVLMMLMSLEFMSLIILLMLVDFLMMFMYDGSVIVYFIITIVCEAVMGLTLVTLMVKTHGSDYCKSSLILMC